MPGDSSDNGGGTGGGAKTPGANGGGDGDGDGDGDDDGDEDGGNGGGDDVEVASEAMPEEVAALCRPMYRAAVAGAILQAATWLGAPGQLGLGLGLGLGLRLGLGLGTRAWLRVSDPQDS